MRALVFIVVLTSATSAFAGVDTGLLFPPQQPSVFDRALNPGADYQYQQRYNAWQADRNAYQARELQEQQIQQLRQLNNSMLQLQMQMQQNGR